MPDIGEVKERVAAFCGKELKQNPKELRFLKVTKSQEGWKSKVEVTELNEHLSKMGYPAIYDRNVYEVLLDAEMNVTSFYREGEGDAEDDDLL